jgi:hypothetical protein
MRENIGADEDSRNKLVEGKMTDVHLSFHSHILFDPPSPKRIPHPDDR